MLELDQDTESVQIDLWSYRDWDRHQGHWDRVFSIDADQRFSLFGNYIYPHSYSRIQPQCYDWSQEDEDDL